MAIHTVAAMALASVLFLVVLYTSRLPNASACCTSSSEPPNNILPQEVRLYRMLYEKWIRAGISSKILSGQHWYALYPLFHCPNLLPLPSIFSDGRKWICPTIISAQSCTLVSVGINGDVRFEEAFSRVFPNCRIFAVDGTSYVTSNSIQTLARIGATYLPKLLSTDVSAMDSGQFISLQGLGRQFNFSTIDVLKLDAEGIEWSIFEDVAAGLSGLSVGQIQLEIHQLNGRTIEDSIRLVQRFASAGFALTAVEPNELCPECRELVFVNLAYAPRGYTESWMQRFSYE